MVMFSADEALEALAARVYAYRVLHIVFGSEPTEQELQLLKSPETLQACQTLAAVGYPAESLIDQVSLKDEAVSEASTTELLRNQFTRLFAVPGDSYVKPWESVYVGKTDVLFTQVTLDVRSRYEALGFKAQEKGHFPEDHLSMMLDFMGAVAERAYEAAASGDDAEAQRLVEAQVAFAQQHLANWLPLFCEALEAKDATGFFAAYAQVTRAFVEADQALASQLVASLSSNE